MPAFVTMFVFVTNIRAAPKLSSSPPSEPFLHYSGRPLRAGLSATPLRFGPAGSSRWSLGYHPCRSPPIQPILRDTPPNAPPRFSAFPPPTRRFGRLSFRRSSLRLLRLRSLRSASRRYRKPAASARPPFAAGIRLHCIAPDALRSVAPAASRPLIQPKPPTLPSAAARFPKVSRPPLSQPRRTGPPVASIPSRPAPLRCGSTLLRLRSIAPASSHSRTGPASSAAPVQRPPSSGRATASAGRSCPALLPPQLLAPASAVSSGRPTPVSFAVLWLVGVSPRHSRYRLTQAHRTAGHGAGSLLLPSRQPPRRRGPPRAGPPAP